MPVRVVRGWLEVEVGEGLRTVGVAGVDDSVLFLDVLDDAADQALSAVGCRVDGDELVGAGGSHGC